jgi:hypothetical protein
LIMTPIIKAFYFQNPLSRESYSEFPVLRGSFQEREAPENDPIGFPK